jgi:hypothetical protein
MFENRWYESLASRLERADKAGELDSSERILLLKVEMGQRFFEVLGLQDPVESIWLWLTNLEIPDARRQTFTPAQQQALANIPVLIRFGKYDWLEALKAYQRFPAWWRQYLIMDLKNAVQREPNGPSFVTDRVNKYDEYLFQQPMPYRLRDIPPAPVGNVFFRPTRRLPRTLIGEIDQKLADAAMNVPFQGFSRQPWTKPPIVLAPSDFEDIAKELDKRENDRNILPRTGWQKLVKDVLRYRLVQPNGRVGAPNSEPLTIEGFLHLAGMVGSGKSVSIKLIAAWGAIFGKWRTTIVVSETLAAIQMANDFNQLLADPATRRPVAVPLLGRTNRHTHLTKLYSLDKLPPSHYGPRWLDTRCLIQGTVPVANIQDGPLLPGDEPCERLYETEKALLQGQGVRSCPLFALCPAQQQYRDMPDALIWITTPGAMARSRLPVQMESRDMRLGEVVYHESRLVAFDEVDTVQQWFDNVYATELPLIDSNGGALDVLDRATAEGLNRGYPASNLMRRWIASERRARETGLQVCTFFQRYTFLSQWVGQQYFTAMRLFLSLSRRLAGTETQKNPTPQQESIQRALLDIFSEFHDDELMPPGSSLSDTNINPTTPRGRLHVIADAILARTGSIVDTRTSDLCRSWIEECVPDIQNILAMLQQQRQSWEQTLAKKKKQLRAVISQPPDDLQSLVIRLELCVTVSVLERLVRIVFQEWYHAPLYITSRIPANQRVQRVPADLIGVIPTAATGSLFGFLYVDEEKLPDTAPGEDDSSSSTRDRRLTAFQYSHIGRCYLLRFPDLLAKLGYPGPHVLATSGTSWLPDSAALHISVAPQAVLEPNPQSQQAIASSEFYFAPQFDPITGKPIFVSGSGDLESNVALLATCLAEVPNLQTSPLQIDRLWLEKEGATKVEWRDRQRQLLFVNSYDQVKEVAQALIAARKDWAADIYGVVRSKDDIQENFWVPASRLFARQQLSLGDIERFTKVTKGRILIAPLQAIGRGYNILNEERVAAFGSVYFLIRPMQVPFDLLARAQWLNRRTLDWCDDASNEVWKAQTFLQRGEKLRQKAHKEWDEYEGGPLNPRYGFLRLDQERKRNLAAYTAAIIIQACGRLLRGGVPFRAYFVDAAWAPESADPDTAEKDTPEGSLLLAMIGVLETYCRQDPIARSLYQPLVTALQRIQGLK